MHDKLTEIIRSQQEGKENTPEFMIGEQLLEIAAGDDQIADLLINDLSTDGMKLSDAAKQLKSYADKNKGKASCFCITPRVAEKILRDFYHLPEPSESGAAPKAESFIDLSDFI